MTTPARTQVSQRGLTPTAVGALIPLMTSVGFDELGLVKALLKRFFSDGPWTATDSASLANAVGPPADGMDTVVRHALAPDLELVAGWIDGAFFLDVEMGDDVAAATDPQPPPLDLTSTFGRGVTPEPTPNPRTIRFATGHRGVDASASYRRGDAADGPVAAIFAADDDVVDVLVAADFVAVSLRRPDRWPRALAPVLDAVAAGFALTSDGDGDADAEPAASATPDLDVRGITSSPPAPSSTSSSGRRTTRLDRAWAALADADPTTPDGLGRLLATAADDDTDSAHRQVAAQLLDRAPLPAALPAWDQLLGDASRGVRRAALDAIVGAEDERCRPLLERALTDPDAWMRWKALHGLVVLGVGPSIAAVEPLADDPDFRVRLEAANARR